MRLESCVAAAAALLTLMKAFNYKITPGRRVSHGAVARGKGTGRAGAYLAEHASS